MILLLDGPLGFESVIDGDIPDLRAHPFLPAKFAPLREGPGFRHSQTYASYQYADGSESRDRVGFGLTTLTGGLLFLLNEQNNDFADFSNFFEGIGGVGSDTEFLIPQMLESSFRNRLWMKDSMTSKKLGRDHWTVTLNIKSVRKAPQARN